MAYCLAMGSQADVLTFSMISMLNNIQVRALDLSDSFVYVNVSSHDLMSHQHHGKSQSSNGDWKNELKWGKEQASGRTRVVVGGSPLALHQFPEANPRN